MKEIESWQNGKWIPNSEIGTKLWDAHYFFGWAVFDAFRSYNHILHLADEHLERFIRSANLAEISCTHTVKYLRSLVGEVMAHNEKFFENDEYRFMVFLSPGYFRIYDDMGLPENILTINVTNCSRYAKHVFPFLKNGVKGLISSQKHIPSRFLDPKVKSCSRLHYGIADAEASRYGKGVYPILLDEHGYIAESSGSNIGFISGDKLCLPKDNNILRGCTMKFVEDIIEMDIIKDNWEVYDLVNSDGAFFTSTFSGILPCYRIIYRDKMRWINNGRREIEYIMKKFSDLVRVDTYEQWKKWYMFQRTDNR